MKRNRVHDGFQSGLQRIRPEIWDKSRNKSDAYLSNVQLKFLYAGTGSATSHSSDIFGHGKHVFVTHPPGNGLHLRILSFAR